MGNYVGIDIGTTHIKTGITDTEGNLLALYKADTPLIRAGGREYYEPQTLYELVQSQIQKALNNYSDILGIGITGMAEAGLVLDRLTLQEKSEIIPWFDKCTLSLSQRISEEEEKEYFYTTGLRNSFKYGIYKYLWCLEHFDLESDRTLWLSVCDYIYFRLTGKIVTEPTFAARTFVYDIRNMSWDNRHLKKVGLTGESFPMVVPSGSFVGCLWNTQIPAALCGHDHICSAFGLIDKDGQLCNSCGTAETYVGKLHQLPGQEQAEESGLVYGPFVDGISYFGMANLSSSGQSMEWVRKQIQQQEISYEQVNEYLNSVEKIPGDILYYPYLAGMGSPCFSAQCSGAFLGLRAEHGKAHILQSVIEGICYQSKWILECCFSQDISEIVCTGGATASDWWMQCKADILNKEIAVSDVEEGTLTGAVSLMQWVNGGQKERQKKERQKKESQKKESKKEESQKKESQKKERTVFQPRSDRAEAYKDRYLGKFLPAAQFISSFAVD